LHARVHKNSGTAAAIAVASLIGTGGVVALLKAGMLMTLVVGCEV